MLCRLCLIDSIKVINIFEGDGERFKIAEIISQHFWFVPRKDDYLSNICSTCWSKVDSFHQFYCFIQDAQKKLSQISFTDRNSGNTRDYLKKENDDNDEWMCDTAVNDEYVDMVHDNVVTKGIKIKSENYDNEDKESSHDKFEEVNDPIDIDYTNQNIDVDSKINLTSFSNDDKKTSPSKTKISGKKKRGRPKKRPRNVSDTEEDLPLTHFIENKTKRDKNEKSESDNFVQNKPKRDKNEKSEYLEKSKEKDDIIAKYMILKCEICCEEFTTFAQIRQHFRTKHNKKGYVVCCNKKLYRRFLLLDHINKHLNPECFKCDKCNKSFVDSKNLKFHMRIHCLDNSKLFECDHCLKKFVTNSRLSRHKLIHMPPEERQFICDDCGKAFSTKFQLQQHRGHVHEHAYGKMCHICAKVIIGTTMFEKHQLEHAGIVEPKVQCKECGAWLKHKDGLRKHMYRHAESLSIHKCEICGKIAPSKGALRSHIRYVHEAEKTYQCGVCDKAFKKPKSLREHMATHTGEILYTCPHCPQTFNSSSNMHSHRKKNHRKEWEESRKDRGLPVNEVILDIRSQGNKTDSKEYSIENNSHQMSENETNIDSTYNEQNLFSLVLGSMQVKN